MIKIICNLLLYGLVFPAFAAGPLQPNQLTTEYRVNPLGIAEKQPRFSWTFKTTERNQFQSAYEIIVSAGLDNLSKGIGEIWSTGKISSAQNTLIPYMGKPLQSFTRYYWRVRTYNTEMGTGSWSEPAWFETAMLRKEDWAARWIDRVMANTV